MKHDIGAKFCLNSASQLCLPTSKKRSLSIMRLLALVSTLQKICSKRAKKLMDLFPWVPQTDAILFIVQCRGRSHGKMCFLSTNGVQDDNSHDWRVHVLSPVYTSNFYVTTFMWQFLFALVDEGNWLIFMWQIHLLKSWHVSFYVTNKKLSYTKNCSCRRLVT